MGREKGAGVLAGWDECREKKREELEPETQSGLIRVGVSMKTPGWAASNKSNIKKPLRPPVHLSKKGWRRAS